MKFLMSSVAFVQRWWLLPRLSPGFPVDVRLPKVAADGCCPRLYPNKWDSVQIQSVRLDKMILLFRWQARPWYKPERTGLGYYKDKFLVFIGWHSEMPGPQWVPYIPASWFSHMIYFLIAWEALDIDLKNWSVDLYFTSVIFPDEPSTCIRVPWSLKMVRLRFSNLILIDVFCCAVGQEEVMQKAVQLQGCPIPGHWSRSSQGGR